MMIRDKLKKYIEQVVSVKMNEKESYIKYLENNLEHASNRLDQLEKELKQSNTYTQETIKRIDNYIAESTNQLANVKIHDTYFADISDRLIRIEKGFTEREKAWEDICTKYDSYFADITNRLILQEKNSQDDQMESDEINKKHDGYFADIVKRLDLVEDNIISIVEGPLADVQRQYLESKHQTSREDDLNVQQEERVLREIAQLAVQVNKLRRSIKITETEIEEEPETESHKHQNAYESIDYFDFEDRFRGSREAIKKNFMIYLPYLKGKTSILDVGCGRGEFLELVKEQGISGIGVDLYEESVEYCKARGLKAEYRDAIEYLKSSNQFDLIFAGQIIEHLKLDQLLELCRLSYERLSSGGSFIFETPNPTSLAIYTNAFYIDPSHEKPVHPLFMDYCLRNVGFTDIEVIYPESSKPHLNIPLLKSDYIENLDDFNNAILKVENILYGSQDYIMVANKS